MFPRAYKTYTLLRHFVSMGDKFYNFAALQPPKAMRARDVRVQIIVKELGYICMCAEFVEYAISLRTYHGLTHSTLCDYD